MEDMSLNQFTNLTYREEIGYTWEVDSQSFLTNECHVTFCGNPVDLVEWKAKVGSGPDVKIESYSIDIECKFNQAPVFPSYIERDFIPRFQDSYAEYKIVLTNDKEMYSEKDRNLLQQKGIKLFCKIDLLNLIYRLKWISHKKSNKGNKSRYLKGITNRLESVEDGKNFSCLTNTGGECLYIKHKGKKRWELSIPPCYSCFSWDDCILYDEYRDCLTQLLNRSLAEMKPNEELLDPEEKLLRKLIKCYNKRTFLSERLGYLLFDDDINLLDYGLNQNNHPRWKIQIKV